MKNCKSSYKNYLKIETFTTQTAEIWTVIVTPEHTFFQNPQVKERHITHITVMWSLLTMYD